MFSTPRLLLPPLLAICTVAPGLSASAGEPAPPVQTPTTQPAPAPEPQPTPQPTPQPAPSSEPTPPAIPESPGQAQPAPAAQPQPAPQPASTQPGQAQPAPAPATQPAPAPYPPPANTGWAQTAPPPQPLPPPRADRRRRQGRGLLIAGWTMFGASYIVSAMVGTFAVDSANTLEGSNDANQRKWGLRMMIPIGGPFAAIPVGSTASGKLFSGMSGIVQTGGVAMGIAGAVLYARSRNPPPLAFGVAPARDGAALTVGGRF